MKPEVDWQNEFPGSVTICDPQGTILFMNNKSIEMFHTQGGAALVGTNLLHCHPEPSRTKLSSMLENRQQNVYTIEKNGIKKLVYQTPWYSKGQYAGFIEMVLEIPDPMPHFVRS